MNLDYKLPGGSESLTPCQDASLVLGEEGPAQHALAAAGPGAGPGDQVPQGGIQVHHRGKTIN